MLNRLILYVEDREDDVLLLKHALDQARHTGGFIHFATLEEAEAFLQKTAAENNLPDIILVDLHLGSRSGRDLIQFIRSSDRLRKIPVVSLSGSYVFEDLDQAYETGANLFLIKPTDLRGWTDLVFKLRDYFPPA